MIYELKAYNTDSRYPTDIRYRKYTSSKIEATNFGKIKKIQFSDSGHGIVFQAIEHHGLRKPNVYELSDYVFQELARIKAEAKEVK